MSVVGSMKNNSPFAFRALPTGDDEFEEVALRLAESGAFDDLVRPWRNGDDWASVKTMVERVCEILGRDVEVRVGRIWYGSAAPWFSTATWRNLPGASGSEDYGRDEC